MNTYPEDIDTSQQYNPYTTGKGLAPDEHQAIVGGPNPLQGLAQYHLNKTTPMAGLNTYLIKKLYTNGYYLKGGQWTKPNATPEDFNAILEGSRQSFYTENSIDPTNVAQGASDFSSLYNAASFGYDQAAANMRQAGDVEVTDTPRPIGSPDITIRDRLLEQRQATGNPLPDFSKLDPRQELPKLAADFMTPGAEYENSPVGKAAQFLKDQFSAIYDEEEKGVEKSGIPSVGPAHLLAGIPGAISGFLKAVGTFPVPVGDPNDANDYITIQDLLGLENVKLNPTRGKETFNTAVDLAVPNNPLQAMVELIPGIGLIPGTYSAVAKTLRNPATRQAGLKALRNIMSGASDFTSSDAGTLGLNKLFAGIDPVGSLLKKVEKELAEFDSLATVKATDLTTGDLVLVTDNKGNKAFATYGGSNRRNGQEILVQYANGETGYVQSSNLRKSEVDPDYADEYSKAILETGKPPAPIPTGITIKPEYLKYAPEGITEIPLEDIIKFNAVQHNIFRTKSPAVTLEEMQEQANKLKYLTKKYLRETGASLSGKGLNSVNLDDTLRRLHQRMNLLADQDNSGYGLVPPGMTMREFAQAGAKQEEIWLRQLGVKGQVTPSAEQAPDLENRIKELLTKSYDDGGFQMHLLGASGQDELNTLRKRLQTEFDYTDKELADIVAEVALDNKNKVLDSGLTQDQTTLLDGILSKQADFGYTATGFTNAFKKLKTAGLDTTELDGLLADLKRTKNVTTKQTFTDQIVEELNRLAGNKVDIIPDEEDILKLYQDSVDYKDFSTSIAKLANLKTAKPRLSNAESFLDEVDEDLFDVSNARDSYDEFSSLEREDFDSAAEFKEAQDEAWDAFIASLKKTEPGPGWEDRVLSEAKVVDDETVAYSNNIERVIKINPKLAEAYIKAIQDGVGLDINIIEGMKAAGFSDQDLKSLTSAAAVTKPKLPEQPIEPKAEDVLNKEQTTDEVIKNMQPGDPELQLGPEWALFEQNTPKPRIRIVRNNDPKFNGQWTVLDYAGGPGSIKRFNNPEEAIAYKDKLLAEVQPISGAEAMSNSASYFIKGLENKLPVENLPQLSSSNIVEQIINAGSAKDVGLENIRKTYWPQAKTDKTLNLTDEELETIKAGLTANGVTKTNTDKIIALIRPAKPMGRPKGALNVKPAVGRVNIKGEDEVGVSIDPLKNRINLSPKVSAKESYANSIMEIQRRLDSGQTIDNPDIQSIVESSSKALNEAQESGKFTFTDKELRNIQVTAIKKAREVKPADTTPPVQPKTASNIEVQEKILDEELSNGIVIPEDGNIDSIARDIVQRREADFSSGISDDPAKSAGMFNSRAKSIASLLKKMYGEGKINVDLDTNTVTKVIKPFEEELAEVEQAVNTLEQGVPIPPIAGSTSSVLTDAQLIALGKPMSIDGDTVRLILENDPSAKIIYKDGKPDRLVIGKEAETVEDALDSFASETKTPVEIDLEKDRLQRRADRMAEALRLGEPTAINRELNKGVEEVFGDLLNAEERQAREFAEAKARLEQFRKDRVGGREKPLDIAAIRERQKASRERRAADISNDILPTKRDDELRAIEEQLDREARTWGGPLDQLQFGPGGPNYIPPRGLESASGGNAGGSNYMKYTMGRPERRPMTNREKLKQIVLMQREAISTLDMSALLRQSLLATLGNKRLAVGAFKESFKAWRQVIKSGDLTYAQKIMDSLTAHNWELKTQGERKLYLGDLTGDARKGLGEELIPSSILEDIPGIGRGPLASRIAYSTFLAKIRSDIFDDTIKMWQKGDILPGIKAKERLPATWRGNIDPKNKEIPSGYLGPNDPNVEALIDWINITTGRGSFGKETFLIGDKHLGEIAQILFSPRLLASRIQTFGKIGQAITGYGGMPTRIRYKIAADTVNTVLTITSLIWLAKQSGLAEVDLNPSSSDFGKMKIGGTRIDPWGGYQQVARLVYMLATQQRKSVSGETFDLTNKDLGNTLVQFLGNKFAPMPGTIFDYGAGLYGKDRTITGSQAPSVNPEETKFWLDLASHMAPLFLQDLAAAVKYHGEIRGDIFSSKPRLSIGNPAGILKGAALASPAFFGIGASTFETNMEKLNKSIDKASKEGITYTSPTTGQPITKWWELDAVDKRDIKNKYPEIEEFLNSLPPGERGVIAENREGDLLDASKLLLELNDPKRYQLRISEIVKQYATEFATIPEGKTQTNKGEWQVKVESYFNSMNEAATSTDDPYMNAELRDTVDSEFRKSLNDKERAKLDQILQGSSDPTYAKLKQARASISKKYWDVREAEYQALKDRSTGEIKVFLADYPTFTSLAQASSPRNMDWIKTKAVYDKTKAILTDRMNLAMAVDPVTDALRYFWGYSDTVHSAQAQTLVAGMAKQAGMKNYPKAPPPKR